MPQKPDKYGIKVWALVDSQTRYFYNGEIYLGKVGHQPEKGQAMRVVLQLTQPIMNSGRNITTDQFFTSIPLAQELSKNRLTLTGTLNKRKPDVPPQFLSTTGKPERHSMFVFSENMMLTSYFPKRDKVVLLLSTMHNSPQVSEFEHRKPLVILDYNRTKGGVDTVDQMAHHFTARRKSLRYPMTLFGNLLDLAGINAMIIFINRNPSWRPNHSKGPKRATFLRELALGMMEMCINHRIVEHPTGAFQPGPRAAIEATINIQTLEDGKQAVRKACYLCQYKDRRTQQIRPQYKRKGLL
jgi:hypothetical protein